MKFAAIDIGSNAIRLLIEEIHTDGNTWHIEKVSLTRVPIRLGEDVFRKGKISGDKIRQLTKAMKAFWYLMEVHEVVYFRACATSAMREAKNRKEVLNQVRKGSRIDIEVLSGDEEAELIFSNYLTQNLRSDQSYLYIDVGGGSTELTFIQDGKKIRGKSFDLGTVRMLSTGVNEKEWNKVEAWMAKYCPAGQTLTAIGTGGNINTLFKIQGKKPSETISETELQGQYDHLTSLSYDERITRLRLRPDRADVIVPAALIYLRILKLGGIKEMLVPKIGLSDGIILDMFRAWTTSPEVWKREFRI